ncbi:hypothetical protein AHF37_01560 [Paragonimus kellicotti]|nr:hypothetical protein AHF37_01560 [Paragonimus kellicotti]
MINDDDIKAFGNVIIPFTFVSEIIRSMTEAASSDDLLHLWFHLVFKSFVSSNESRRKFIKQLCIKIWNQNHYVQNRTLEYLKSSETSFQTLVLSSLISFHIKPQIGEDSSSLALLFVNNLLKALFSNKSHVPPLVPLCTGVIKHLVDPEMFKVVVMPALHRAILRSAEANMVGAAVVLRSVSFDLDFCADELVQPIVTHLCALSDSIRRSTVTLLCAIISRCSELDAITAVLKCIYTQITGPEGKKAGKDARLTGLTCLGEMCNHGAKRNAVSDAVGKTAVGLLVEFMEQEIELDYGYMFTSQIWFFFYHSQTKGFDTKTAPTVRCAYLACLDSAFTNVDIQDRLPSAVHASLLTTVERAIGQPNHSPVVFEAVCASLIWLRYFLAKAKRPLCHETIKSQLHTTPIWTLLVGTTASRRPWFSERFLQTAPDYVLRKLAHLMELVLRELNPFIPDEALSGVYRNLVLLAIHPHYDSVLETVGPRVWNEVTTEHPDTNLPATKTERQRSPMVGSYVAKLVADLVRITSFCSDYCVNNERTAKKTPKDSSNIRKDLPVEYWRNVVGLYLASLLSASHTIVITGIPTLWERLRRYVGFPELADDPEWINFVGEDYLFSKWSELANYFANLSCLDQSHTVALRRLISWSPLKFGQALFSLIFSRLLDQKFVHASERDVHIMLTPASQLYNQDLLERSLLDVLAEQLTDKQLESVRAELTKEAETRQRMFQADMEARHLTNLVTITLQTCALKSVCLSAESAPMVRELFNTICSPLSDLLVRLIASPLVAPYVLRTCVNGVTLAMLLCVNSVNGIDLEDCQLFAPLIGWWSVRILGPARLLHQSDIAVLTPSFCSSGKRLSLAQRYVLEQMVDNATSLTACWSEESIVNQTGRVLGFLTEKRNKNTTLLYAFLCPTFEYLLLASGWAQPLLEELSNLPFPSLLSDVHDIKETGTNEVISPVVRKKWDWVTSQYVKDLLTNWLHQLQSSVPGPNSFVSVAHREVVLHVLPFQHVFRPETVTEASIKNVAENKSKKKLNKNQRRKQKQAQMVADLLKEQGDDVLSMPYETPAFWPSLPLWPTLQVRIWIARSDLSSEVAVLAERLWFLFGLDVACEQPVIEEENQESSLVRLCDTPTISLMKPMVLAQRLLLETTRPVASVQKATADAFALCLMGRSADELAVALGQLVHLYKVMLHRDPPVKDSVGRILVPESADRWRERVGLAFALARLSESPNLSVKTVRSLRKGLSAAKAEPIDMDRERPITTITAVTQDSTSSDKDADRSNRADLWLLEMFRFLVPDGLNDRNSVVQSVMLQAGLNAVSIYGRAHFGQLLPILETFLNKAPNVAELDAVRQSVLILTGSLSQNLAADDPKVWNIFNRLITTLNFPSDVVQQAVEDCLASLVTKLSEEQKTKTIARLMSTLLGSPVYAERHGAAHGIAGIASGLGIMSLKHYGIIEKLIPALEDTKSSKRREESVELLATMTHCAPKQLSACLPQIVPRLLEVLVTSQEQLKQAGLRALKQIGSVIRNPEVQALVPLLTSCLQDPLADKMPCLLALRDTCFVHVLDAPSLALIVPVIQRAFADRSTEARKTAAQIFGNLHSLARKEELQPYVANIMPPLKACLLDAVPDIRSVAAAALGALVRGMGESCFTEVLPWLITTMTSETSSVDRSGAAQGLAEVLGAMGIERLRSILPDLVRAAASGSKIPPHVRDGYLMLFIYLPAIFQDAFCEFIGPIIPTILKSLSDETEYLRETALRAAQQIVQMFAESSFELLLPELEQGVGDPNWRIRHSSVQLLGDLLYQLSGLSGKGTTKTQDEDDTFGTSAAHDRLKEFMGAERHDRVLARIHMVRSDPTLIVRQAAIHVWKVVVPNTSRTLREIMPVLIRLLLTTLGSSNREQQQVAARALGDVVRKLGERILPEVIPLLVHGLNSAEPDHRRGVCTGLMEIMRNCPREQLIYPTVNVKVFAYLASVAGDALTRQLNRILPALLTTVSQLNGQPDEEEDLLHCASVLICIHDAGGIRYVFNTLLSGLVLGVTPSAPSLPNQVTPGTLNYRLACLRLLNAYLERWSPESVTTQINDLRQGIREAIFDFRKTTRTKSGEEFLPGFSDPNLPLTSLIKLYADCTLHGRIDIREPAAQALCECISHASGVALQSCVVKVIGPLIRLLGERQTSVVRMALVESLTSLIHKLVNYIDTLIVPIRRTLCDKLPEIRRSGARTFELLYNTLGVRLLDSILPDLLVQLDDTEANPYVLDGIRQLLVVKGKAVMPYLVPKCPKSARPFVIQLQTTILKCLGDPHRPMRLLGGKGLASLVGITSKLDPLLIDLAQIPAHSVITHWPGETYPGMMRPDSSVPSAGAATALTSTGIATYPETSFYALRLCLIGSFGKAGMPALKSSAVSQLGFRCVGVYVGHIVESPQLNYDLNPLMQLLIQGIKHELIDIRLLTTVVLSHIAWRWKLLDPQSSSSMRARHLSTFLSIVITGSRDKASTVRLGSESALAVLCRFGTPNSKESNSAVQICLETVDSGNRSSLDALVQRLRKQSWLDIWSQGCPDMDSTSMAF